MGIAPWKLGAGVPCRGWCAGQAGRGALESCSARGWVDGAPLAEDGNLMLLSLNSKVRSFGTEDRPTDRPAPPREEIYEYIIFRGSDIKDITVCEPPKAQHTLPQDPAIVQVSVLLCFTVGTVSRGAGFQMELGVICLAGALNSRNSLLVRSGLICVQAVGVPAKGLNLSRR